MVFFDDVYLVLKYGNFCFQSRKSPIAVKNVRRDIGGTVTIDNANFFKLKKHLKTTTITIITLHQRRKL
jgi:hypothetical protein